MRGVDGEAGGGEVLQLRRDKKLTGIKATNTVSSPFIHHVNLYTAEIRTLDSIYYEVEAVRCLKNSFFHFNQNCRL